MIRFKVSLLIELSFYGFWRKDRSCPRDAYIAIICLLDTELLMLDHDEIVTIRSGYGYGLASLR